MYIFSLQRARLVFLSKVAFRQTQDPMHRGYPGLDSRARGILGVAIAPKQPVGIRATMLGMKALRTWARRRANPVPFLLILDHSTPCAKSPCFWSVPSYNANFLIEYDMRWGVERRSVPTVCFSSTHDKFRGAYPCRHVWLSSGLMSKGS